MRSTVMVPFAGPPSAGAAARGAPLTVPLTWGQRALWMAIRRRGPGHILISMRRVVPTPRKAQSDVDSVARAIGALIGQHGSLRTRTHFESEPATQQVADGGQQPVLVVTNEAVDPHELAGEMAATPFDHAGEWPQRIALIVSEGQVTHIVLVFSHVTVDFQAAELVMRDLRMLLLRGHTFAPAGLQSADVARAEQGERNQRRSTRAVEYWLDTFRRLPTDTLPEVETAQEPRFRRVILTSEAADTATRLLARTHQVTSSTVLLAAVAGVINAWSGTDVCGIHTMVNNRAIEGYRDAVAKLNQLGLVAVDLSGKPGFAEALPQVWHAAFDAYRNSYYDPYEMMAAFEAAGLPYATGISPHCYLNDIRLAPDTDLFGRDTSRAGLRDALERTTFTVGEGIEHFTWRMRIEIVDATEGVGLALTGDTAYLPPRIAERFLRDIEQVLVDAAQDDLPWPWTSRDFDHD